MAYKSAYETRIRNYAHHSVDPRHVEAWMRLEHGTLDQLSTAQFISEVIMAERCILADPSQSERLAKSYGL
jgi:hypothetical protein